MTTPFPVPFGKFPCAGRATGRACGPRTLQVRSGGAGRAPAFCLVAGVGRHTVPGRGRVDDRTESGHRGRLVENVRRQFGERERGAERGHDADPEQRVTAQVEEAVSRADLLEVQRLTPHRAIFSSVGPDGS